MRRLIAVGTMFVIAASAVVGFAAGLGVDSAYLTGDTNTLLDTSLSLTLSNPGPVTVGEDASVSAQADLAGPSGAMGYVYYNVYNGSDCSSPYTNAGSSTVTNGNVDLPSDTITFTTAETYYWQAWYTGDGENLPSQSDCIGLVVVESEPQEPSQLYLDFSEHEIDTHSGGGTADLAPKNTLTLPSDHKLVVAGGGSWLLSLHLTGPKPFSGAVVRVDVWTSSNSCGTVPSNTAANYVAGTLSPHHDLDNSTTIPGTVQVALSNNASFSPSTSHVTLCLRISNVDGSNGNADPHHIKMAASSDTYLSGPFTVD